MKQLFCYHIADGSLPNKWTKWIHTPDTGYEDPYNSHLSRWLGMAWSRYSASDAWSIGRFIEQLNLVEKGEIVETNGDIDYLDVTVTRQGVSFLFDWDNGSPKVFTFEEFKAAVEGWAKFLQLPEAADVTMTIELPSAENT